MNRTHWQRWLHAIWYGNSGLYLLLLPLSWLYCGLVGLRRLAYRSGLFRSVRLNARVIVVGNISVGGTGKTPLVIALTQRLQQAGYAVGILARGYRGTARHWPQSVTPDSEPERVGDEAVLLADATGVPVYAGPDRVATGRALLQARRCDIIICDDGLQHYALARDLEIALVDAGRGHGNGQCLPAGPLRETTSRLKQVDAVVCLDGQDDRAFSLSLSPGRAYRLRDPSDMRSLDSFQADVVHAMAGIANPGRFFADLRKAGLTLITHEYPDHYPFKPGDLAFGDDKPVLMTGKDAVKCAAFAQSNWWCVPVEAHVDPAFVDWLIHVIARMEQPLG